MDEISHLFVTQKKNRFFFFILALLIWSLVVYSPFSRRLFTFRKRIRKTKLCVFVLNLAPLKRITWEAYRAHSYYWYCWYRWRRRRRRRRVMATATFNWIDTHDIGKRNERWKKTGTQLATTKASNEMIHSNLCFFSSLFFRVTI